MRAPCIGTELLCIRRVAIQSCPDNDTGIRWNLFTIPNEIIRFRLIQQTFGLHNSSINSVIELRPSYRS